MKQPPPIEVKTGDCAPEAKSPTMAARKPALRFPANREEVMMGCKTGGTVVAVTLALLATTALAQQASPPAAPAPAAPAAAQPEALPPGSPLIGRPADNPAAAKLAPVPSPPLAIAADKIPVGDLKAPKGFNIELYASGMPNARSMAYSPKGTVFVGSRLQDKVYAITNKDGKRQVHVLVSGLYRPNGVAYKDGTLYIAELSQISKIENVDDKIDASPKPVVIYNDLPKDEAHGWKYLAIGPDNKLYFEVGQPGNNVLHDKNHGQLRRINLDGSGAEVIAYGIRNTVGFDWNPRNHNLYFTDNGRDWLSEDLPNDKLNRITKLGEDFGEPYCHQGNIPDIDFGWGHKCSDYVPPVALMGPHAAALGLKFYTGHMFPAEYRDQMFVARHGSWNRTIKFGGDIALVRLNRDGSVKSVEPFITGFLQNNNYIGRPVDVMNMPDGSMLISDDWNGAVFRVSYGNKKTAAR
jgi:glucose/arabinose dehydrogenase